MWTLYQKYAIFLPFYGKKYAESINHTDGISDKNVEKSFCIAIVQKKGNSYCPKMDMVKEISILPLLKLVKKD